MGIEPTRQRSSTRLTDFEDQGRHQPQQRYRASWCITAAAFCRHQSCQMGATGGADGVVWEQEQPPSTFCGHRRADAKSRWTRAPALRSQPVPRRCDHARPRPHAFAKRSTRPSQIAVLRPTSPQCLACCKSALLRPRQTPQRRPANRSAPARCTGGHGPRQQHRHAGHGQGGVIRSPPAESAESAAASLGHPHGNDFPECRGDCCGFGDWPINKLAS